MSEDKSAKRLLILSRSKLLFSPIFSCFLEKLLGSVTIALWIIQSLLLILIFSAIIFFFISKLSSRKVIDVSTKNSSTIKSALIIIVSLLDVSLIQIPFFVITAKYFLSSAKLFLILRYSFLRMEEKL